MAITSKLSAAEIEILTSMERAFDPNSEKVWMAQRRIKSANPTLGDEIEEEFYRDEHEAKARFERMAILKDTRRARLMYGQHGAMTNVDTFGEWEG